MNCLFACAKKSEQAYDEANTAAEMATDVKVSAKIIPYHKSKKKNKDDQSPESDTESYDLIVENPFVSPKNEALSTFSIDVDNASFSNARRFLESGALPPKDAVRIEEFINYFDYDYPQPTDSHPFSVNTEVASCPWNDQHKLVHIGLQGKKLNYEDIKPCHLTFLIDVSGSMQDQNKLPLLKKSFGMLLTQLSEKDRVAIVVYAGAEGVALPSTSCADKQKIAEAFEKMTAGGGTAGGAGIELAYKIAQENLIKGGNNRVILATDGDFNVGQSSTSELVRMIEEKRKLGIFLTVLGFGDGNYNDAMLEQLSNKGDGNYYYIDRPQEAEKVFVKQMRATMFTIAKDVKIQVEFNPTKVQAYRLIGYENRKLNKEDFNDDTKDAGELGAGHTVTAIYEIIPVGIKSEFLKDVDALKYQNQGNHSAANSDELMTVKLRYKKPSEDTSILLSTVIKNNSQTYDKASENFRLSAAVAEFGLLLRESEFKKNASYQQCLEILDKAQGKDENGYRHELWSMVKNASGLKR